MEVGFGFCSAHLGGVDCVTMLTTLIILTDWRSANQQSLARLGAVPSPWTRSTPWVRMASRAGGRVVSRAWSRARQRDRRWNCRVHWLQLRAVVPICNKQWLLFIRDSFGAQDLQSVFRWYKKVIPQKAVVEETTSITIAHLRVKIFGFFPRFAIFPMLMIGNNVVWRICRICTVTVTQFAESQLQARIFCKTCLPSKSGPCQSSVGDEGIPNQNWKPAAINIMSDQETL